MSDHSQIPTEWWQLLVRIDERTKGIEATLGEIKQSHTDLESRLRVVEDEQKVREGLKDRYFETERKVVDMDRRLSTIETTSKNGATIADWAWRLFGPAVSAGCVFLAVLYFGGKDDERDRSYTLTPPAASAPAFPDKL